ncbi:MAG: tripartite tricarboxylate transporter TctB family protein [Negativicutes bacterium]
MRKADIVTSCVLVVLASIGAVQSYGMQYMTEDGVPGPGFVPLWTCLLVILLSGIMLVASIRKIKSDANSTPVFDRTFYKSSLILLGASSIAMALVKPLGMLVCIGLLTGFLSRVLGHKHWPMNIALAVGTPIIFWLLFTFALEVRFPEGILGL